jgi:hypothetical protein
MLVLVLARVLVLVGMDVDVGEVIWWWSIRVATIYSTISIHGSELVYILPPRI